MPRRASAAFDVLRNPSEADVSKLLAKAGAAGLRGIEDHSGNVFIWAFDDGTHLMVAVILDIHYDAAADYVQKLTGKTFYIRSVDDWADRERRRSERGSFTDQVKRGLAKKP